MICKEISVNDASVKAKTAKTAVLSAAVLLSLFPDISRDAVREAISMCLERLIPSLFCFTVLSGIVVSMGMTNGLKRLLLPLRRAFGLSSKGAEIFLLGNLCGFPIGAMASAEAKKNGEITENEAIRVAAASNNVSIGFAVAYVGDTVLESRSVGMAIYLFQFLASVIVLLISRRLLPHSSKDNEITSSEKDNIFCNAVTSSAVTCLGISGFVCVFSAILAYVGAAADVLSLPQWTKAAVGVILEISSGCKSAEILSGYFKVFAVAFAIGFSGVSVIAQSASFFKNASISLTPYAALKTAQGLLCAVITVLYCRLCPVSLPAFLFENDSFIFDERLMPAIALALILCHFLTLFARKVFHLGKYS